MCGRYAVKKSTLIIANSLVKKNINVDLDQDNFNCSPGTKLPIIKSATNGKYLEKNIWGLKASWAKEEYKRLHNARLEGIDKKITFKKLIVNFRSVVLELMIKIFFLRRYMRMVNIL
jgi:putative SOS response-associated peptidase YedK